jgi:hypothetical protein
MLGPPLLGEERVRPIPPGARRDSHLPSTSIGSQGRGRRLAMIGTPRQWLVHSSRGIPQRAGRARRRAALTPRGGGAGHDGRGRGTMGDERIGDNHLLDRRTYHPIYRHSLGRSAVYVLYHRCQAHTWQFSLRRISVKNQGRLCRHQCRRCFLPLPSLWPGPRVGSGQFRHRDRPPSTMLTSSGIRGALSMMHTKTLHQDHCDLLRRR